MTPDLLLWLGTFLGIPASAIVILLALSPPLRRLASRLGPISVTKWEHVPATIAEAKLRVWILQTWIPDLRREKPYWLQSLAREAVDFRVLLLDQKLVPARLKARERVSSLLPQNVTDLNDLAAQVNLVGRPRLTARFYSCIPFGPVYVIDDTVYWGIYLADCDSLLGPAFRCSVSSRIGKLVLSSYEAVWRSGIPRSGTMNLGLSGRKDFGATLQSSADIRPLARRFRGALALGHGPGGALCVLRHGDTDLNEAKIFTGALDIGINVRGRAQIEGLRGELENLNWTRVLSSPLRRCVESLSELLGNRVENVELRDELRERSMGEAEGYSKTDYMESLPGYRGVDLVGSFNTRAAGGESYADVLSRLAPLLEEIVAAVKAGDRILVCTHEAPFQVVRLLLEGLTADAAIRTAVQNGEVNWYQAPT